MAHSSGENAEDLAYCGADGFEGARGSLAQQVLELGEDLFDRVEVWRVFGQEEKLGTGRRATRTTLLLVQFDEDGPLRARRHSTRTGRASPGSAAWEAKTAAKDAAIAATPAVSFRITGRSIRLNVTRLRANGAIGYDTQ